MRLLIVVLSAISLAAGQVPTTAAPTTVAPTPPVTITSTTTTATLTWTVDVETDLINCLAFTPFYVSIGVMSIEKYNAYHAKIITNYSQAGFDQYKNECCQNAEVFFTGLSGLEPVVEPLIPLVELITNISLEDNLGGFGGIVDPFGAFILEYDNVLSSVSGFCGRSLVPEKQEESDHRVRDLEIGLIVVGATVGVLIVGLGVVVLMRRRGYTFVENFF